MVKNESQESISVSEADKEKGGEKKVMGYLGIEKNKIMDSILDILQSSYRKLERKNEEYFIEYRI